MTNEEETDEMTTQMITEEMSAAEMMTESEAAVAEISTTGSHEVQLIDLGELK